jgi:ACS family glucarate transporter-like MFS transporter
MKGIAQPNLAAEARQSSNVRWRILALLATFGMISFVLRTNISVASKFMMPELGLTEIQMGQVFSSFMLGYAVFQIPAGFFGDRFGPRLVLTVSAVLWAVTTLFTGLIPGLLVTGFGALLSLLALRFTLGLAEAATYPVATRAVANWMPIGERAFANSIVITGTAVAMIFTPPLVSWLMVNSGWRVAFYATSLLGFAIALVWWRFATDRPEHHGHTSRAELDLIDAGRRAPVGDGEAASPLTLLRHRHLVLICVSYFLDSFVLFIFIFWFFLYLVDERGFGVLKGGVFNSLPYLFALVMIPLCGRLCDRLSVKYGRNWGRRGVALGCLALSSVFLFAGARVYNPFPAIVCLSLSVGFLMSTEGPFWSGVSDIAGTQAGTAGGIMNTAGNLGGVVSTALAPVSVKYLGWGWTFAASSALALVAGLIWLFIRVEPEAPDVNNSF